MQKSRIRSNRGMFERFGCKGSKTNVRRIKWLDHIENSPLKMISHRRADRFFRTEHVPVVTKQVGKFFENPVGSLSCTSARPLLQKICKVRVERTTWVRVDVPSYVPGTSVRCISVVGAPPSNSRLSPRFIGRVTDCWAQ